MLLKQICPCVKLPSKRHFEQARLLVGFYHEFKDFVQFSINRDDFLAVHLAERVECYATFYLQDKV